MKLAALAYIGLTVNGKRLINRQVNWSLATPLNDFIQLKNLVKNSKSDGAVGSPGVRVQDHVTMEQEQDLEPVRV